MGFRIAIVICFVLSSASVRAAQLNTNWLGGVGNWTDPTKWSTGVVPNNAADTYNVNIDNGNATASTVTLQGASPFPSPPNYFIDALTVDSADKLIVRTAALNLSAAPTIAGNIQLDSDGSLKLPAAATIAGAGTITFNSLNTAVSTPSGGLTVGPSITVRGGDLGSPYYGGYAVIGNINGPLTNQGVIWADRNQSVLTVNASTINNPGTLKVSNGGRLGINADFSLNTIGTLVNDGGSFVIYKTLSNTAQTLQVNAPRAWVLAGGTIDGGVIAGAGANDLHVPYLVTSTVNNLTLNGLITLNGSLNITGTFAGTGAISILNPEAIEGTGNINLGIAPVPAGMTIRGGQSTASDDPAKARITLTSNQGVIRAQKSLFNDAGKLRLIGSTISNTGTLEISDGGTLATVGNLSFGTQGTLVVDGGGLLEIGGNLNLATTSDMLDVHAKADGLPYNSYLFATYTGTRTGLFNSVTPGISVTYGTGQIFISGTPLPEPGMAALLCIVPTLLLRRRRRC